MCIQCKSSCLILVRDSSAVRWLLRTCCSRGTSESSTYGKQRIFPPTLGQHISTFRGYLILFSIRNPYINRFTNHLTLRKWCYTALQHDFALEPMISTFVLHCSNICQVTTRKLRFPQCIMGDNWHINKQTNIFIANQAPVKVEQLT